MLHGVRKFLLEGVGHVAAHRERIGRDRIGLPQEDQVAVLVMAALGGRFELFAVQFAGVDLVIINGLERRRVAAGVDRLDILVGIEPGLAQPIGREQMAGGRSRIRECEGTAADVRNGLDAGRRIGDKACPIGDGLAVYGAECGHRLGLRHLMRQHVTERPELRELELAIAHRFNLGVVAGSDEYFDFAADFVADHLADFLVDRHQTRRGVVGLDAEAHRSPCRAVVRCGR